MATLEIHVKSGPAAGQTYSLEGRRSVTIGRAPANALVLRDEKVSSHHARIDVTAGGLILTDLGSKNGTWVEGEQVVGSRLLQPGVDVILGGSAFEVRYPVPMTEGAIAAEGIRVVASPAPITPRAPGPRPTALAPRPSPTGFSTASLANAMASSARAGSDGGRDVVLQPAGHHAQRNLTKAQRNLGTSPSSRRSETSSRRSATPTGSSTA
jgi:predicted component of type VI protein secretion system